LGEVKPTQYFGVEESLMNMHAGQLPCSLAIAAEDCTLVFFDKHDFVDALNTDQIKELLDVVHDSGLVKDVVDSELILRSMHEQKLKDF
jgi:CRP-like cAMP-binding protein